MQYLRLCLIVGQSENPLPVVDSRDCREKRVRNKALQVPFPFTCRAKDGWFSRGVPSHAADDMRAVPDTLNGLSNQDYLTSLGNSKPYRRAKEKHNL
jgi:hypothetical protein